MIQHRSAGPRGASQFSKLTAGACLVLLLASCNLAQLSPVDRAAPLGETARLVQEVKAFQKTLGIEPTDALRRTIHERPALSMLWLWMQRAGTLAVRAPVDIRMAIGFSSLREQLKLEQVYRVEGYSIYYRHGNEFADSRSVATFGFAAEGSARQVKVILHEDLHGDNNFDLPWEIEEAVVTPISSLAAVEFFKSKGDRENLQQAQESLNRERSVARELNALVSECRGIFQTENVEDAKKAILEVMPAYPLYRRQFQRQTVGQHPSTVLEAKLSHDLAYYGYFDRIVSLAEKAGDLRTLINDLKRLPTDTGHDRFEAYLDQLSTQYSLNLQTSDRRAGAKLD
jgi:hypothetical protein